MTVALYARQKSWPLEAVTVRLRRSKIHAADCAEAIDSLKVESKNHDDKLEKIGSVSV
jgi:hypothetical protein